jgi:serine/threonine protein phosphatase PrpC
MTKNATPPIVSRAEALYRLLLFAYPPRFRHIYGQQMALTFRDCCRAALQRDGKLALAGLWYVVLYDLITSACAEHARSCLAWFRHLARAEKECFMPSLLQLDVAYRTDIGLKRPSNEDNVTSVIPQDAQAMTNKGALFIVADGMGGHALGEVASAMAVTLISEAYYLAESDDVLAVLQNAIRQANAAICQKSEQLQAAEPDESKRKPMGTTYVVVVVKGGTAYVANAGDSLAYIIGNDQIKQIAQNHSWVAEQVREGKMTLEEARAQGKNNVITRCLGMETDIEIYAATEQVHDGDILVLCTDGLHNLVSEDEIRTIVEQYGPEESTSRLIARANENGGPDNITTLVARISLGAD